MIQLTAFLLLVTSMTLVTPRASFAETLLAPVPAGEPQSMLYTVTADGAPVGVYAAQNVHGGAYAFAPFSFTGTVTLTITGHANLEHAMILPPPSHAQDQAADVRVRRQPGKLTLTLSRPCHLSIEPDGIRAPLLLFADPPEINTPREGASDVVYFGPGVHKPGVIRLGSDQTLYLAAGAVVKAGVIVENAANVRICGRGILDGNDWPWSKGPAQHFLAVRNSSNVTIEGITMRGAYHWNLVLFRARDVVIHNVKIVNGRVQNDDAFDLCNAQDVTISNCFVRSDDDCVAIKGMAWPQDGEPQPVRNIRIRNTIFWCDRARIFLLGHESVAPVMQDILVSDCDIIHYVMTPFLLEPGEEMLLQNVRFDNIRLLADGQTNLIGIHPTVNHYMHLRRPGHVKGVVFHNIAVSGDLAPDQGKITLSGPDAEHGVDDVLLDHVTINGQPVTSEAPNVKIGPNASNVRIRP
jgi:hypothetical protein